MVSDVVEGCARKTEADFLRFLDMAYGSARALEYQLSLASRLGCLEVQSKVPAQAVEVSKVLNALIRSLRD